MCDHDWSSWTDTDGRLRARCTRCLEFLHPKPDGTPARAYAVLAEWQRKAQEVSGITDLHRGITTKPIAMRKGEWLRCTRGHGIANAVRDIYSGDVFALDDFSEWMIAKPSKDDVAVCPCGAGYGPGVQRYTKPATAEPPEWKGDDDFHLRHYVVTGGDGSCDYCKQPPPFSGYCPERADPLAELKAERPRLEAEGLLMPVAVAEFNARRKAKREDCEKAAYAEAFRNSYPERKAASDRSEALAIAMRHDLHQPASQMLMPYRLKPDE